MSLLLRLIVYGYHCCETMGFVIRDSNFSFFSGARFRGERRLHCTGLVGWIEKVSTGLGH